MRDMPTWKEALINADATIKDAIQILNRVGLRISIAVDGAGKFLGTISDGDIRRGMLKGFSLDAPILNILRSDAIVVPEGLSRDMIMRLMLINKIQQIPIVNEENIIVGLHLWDEINVIPKRSNVFLIMAGGKGTRLMPYTKECPKPLVKVGGKPMIDHIIERAKYFGYSNFLVSLQHLGGMIQDHLGDGSRFNVNLSYLTESSPLGTAGALSLLSEPPDHPMVVTNGDVISDIDYGEILDFHIRNGAFATMAVKLYQWQNPFGVVKMQGIDISGFEEKPVINSHINAGVYVLSPLALKYLMPGVACSMPELFEKLRLDAKKIIAYPMHEPWLDVGRPSDLEKANAEIFEDKE